MLKILSQSDGNCRRYFLYREKGTEPDSEQGSNWWWINNPAIFVEKKIQDLYNERYIRNFLLISLCY